MRSDPALWQTPLHQQNYGEKIRCTMCCLIKSRLESGSDNDLLNISNIVRDHRVASKIPQYFENLDPPLICYQYKNPIRNIIFNYNQVTSDPDVLSSIQSSCSCADSPFLYPTAGHVVTGDPACIPDKGLRSLFKKGIKYRLPSRIDFTKCRSIFVEALHFRLTVNNGVRRKASECMPLTTGKLNVYVLLTLRWIILLHIPIYTNSHLVFQWKHWKGKWKNYIESMSLPLPTKQQTTSSLSEKDTTWKFWRRNWILRVHMYLLSWRKTNFFCVISILSLNQISKLINLTCLHFIGCRDYTKILTYHASYHILVTALLPSYLSI